MFNLTSRREAPMSDETISPLRRRMIEDMTIRNFSADTQRNYIRAVKNLASFLGRSPDTARREDLRRFQLHLTETRVRPPTINATVSALREQKRRARLERQQAKRRKRGAVALGAVAEGRAEVALPRALFAEIMRRIDRLKPEPLPA
jgi:hypothetical protein